MTKEQWIARCATQYARQGQVADDVADEMAFAYAEHLQAGHGDAVAGWPLPESAAAADIAGWTED